MDYQTIQVNRDSRGVLSVLLNRPDVRNAFNEQVIAELTHVFQKEVENPKTKVVLLGGNGPVFSAGGDLNWMKKGAEANFADNLEDSRKLSHMFSIMNEASRPVIGCVHGAAIGGGVGLVSICDIVIATKDSQFSLSEVRLGIVPACIGPFVISKVGPSNARALFLSAERFTSEKAQKIGLIHEVVPSQEDLKEAVESYLTRILQCGPKAVAVAKKLILDLSWPERRAKIEDPMESVSRILAELRTSPEGKEGVQAFLEKRKPSWQA